MTERQGIIPQLAEIFREHGFEGASLSVITERTGLGKGSLYHFFPQGKDQMAEEVLGEIESWFEREVFTVLDTVTDPRQALRAMLSAVESYFHSGRRICLVGAFALDKTRDRFSARIDTFFEAWIAGIASTLERLGRQPAAAQHEAEEILSQIQGALILARGRSDPGLFTRAMASIRDRLKL